MIKQKFLVFMVASLTILNCISTTYIKVNEKESESEVVRIPAGNLRPLLIIGIDGESFPDGLGDYIVMSPGKHTIQIRAIESEFLQTSLTQTFNTGTIAIICPGLNKFSHHNENLKENERWVPFIRELKYNDAIGLIKASTRINDECKFGFQNQFPDLLVK